MQLQGEGKVLTQGLGSWSEPSALSLGEGWVKIGSRGQTGTGWASNPSAECGTLLGWEDISLFRGRLSSHQGMSASERHLCLIMPKMVVFPLLWPSHFPGALESTATVPACLILRGELPH